MQKVLSFIIALFQFIGATLGFVSHKPDINYGGTYRPTRYTTNLYNIIEDGQTDYSIIIAENAKPVEKTAADELSKYLKKMSGADVPVISDSCAESENEIIIGNTNRDVYSDVDFDKLREEGFCLKAVGEKLYDDLQSHGITKLSSLSGGTMPPKGSINFYFSTPQDWK